MNGERRRTVGYSWRGPHGRLDPLDQRSLALARSGLGPTASRGEPVRRHDEWSAHYGEVPATKSRDEMSPFACERTPSLEGARGATRATTPSAQAPSTRNNLPLDEASQ